MATTLSLRDALSLIELLGVGPVRDAGLLDSALARPRAHFAGHDLYPTLHEKAAALLHSLVANRALVDGNKRLAWLATTVFLALNGAPCALSDRDAFSLVLDVATGHGEIGDIAARLAGTEAPDGRP